MIEYLLADWGLFLVKTMTVALAIIFIFGFIFTLIIKQRKETDALEVTVLNEKYEGMLKNITKQAATKEDYKAFKKKAKKHLKKQKDTQKSRLFILQFEGDMRASQVKSLREEISAILAYHQQGDSVLLVLESAGGLVHSYGLAAAQLERLKAAHIPLTISVDTIAASGGYLMACVGNHIISSPFAILGSVGVIGQLPNFHRFLDKHDIDFEQHTAGEYKRTLTLFGKNTDAGRHKFQEELTETHALFKRFVERHRPQLNMAIIATGEYWYGEDALPLNLVDELKTSDSFIQSHLQTHQLLHLKYVTQMPLGQKLSHWLKGLVQSKLLPLFQARFQA